MQLARRLLLCATVLVVLAAGHQVASANPRPVAGDWRQAGLAGYEWHPADELTASQARARLRFLYRNGFDTVYIDLGDYIDATESQDEERLEELRDALRRYVAYASYLGLSVHGVGGGPNWTDEDHRYLGRFLVELVADYNDGVEATERLGGVHFDIEPYADPGTFFADVEASLTAYLETIQDIVLAYREQVTEPANRLLQLGIAIPFWFDASGEAPGPVAFDEVTKPAAFHVIDMVRDLRRAYLVVMSYRNRASGADGSISHARKEFIYASLVRARSGLVVGQRFSPAEPDEAKTTFNLSTRRAFERAADQIVGAFGHLPQFRGLSVDDLDAYMAVS